MVSGNTTNSIYTLKPIDSNIINAGTFGIEGGIIVTGLLIITILLIYKYCKTKEA